MPPIKKKYDPFNDPLLVGWLLKQAAADDEKREAARAAHQEETERREQRRQEIQAERTAGVGFGGCRGGLE